MTIVLSEEPVNLQRPTLKSGPLTLAEMNAAKTCPPCNHNCNQRRNCPADERAVNDCGVSERHMALMAQFWTAYLALLLVAVCAGIAHFLPALSALVNN